MNYNTRVKGSLYGPSRRKHNKHNASCSQAYNKEKRHEVVKANQLRHKQVNSNLSISGEKREKLLNEVIKRVLAAR